MLHVRMASPPALTPAVVSLVSGDPGVRNLVVLPGAARPGRRRPRRPAPWP
ncbi:MAG TPA: hypothetical protein VK586_20795 [Streptosporangiaceae bacterium]|nr:hypothetical protein [Streptosporangiaceae bacterium]